MSLSLTYDQANARVKIDVDGLASEGAAVFTVERSIDQTAWTGVRGTVNQPVQNDNPLTFFDYEYQPDAENFYRVVGRDNAEFVGVGTDDSDQGNGVTLTPTLPAGVAEGDLLVLYVSITAGIGVHSIIKPSGWTEIARDPYALSRSAIFMRVASNVEADPVQVQVGGAIGGNVVGIAQVAAFRYVAASPLAVQTDVSQSGTSTGQIAFPPASVTEDNAVVVAFGGSANTWTSAAASTGFTLMDDPTFDGSDDGSICWQYQIQAGNTDVLADVFAITGGTHSNKHGHTIVWAYDGANAPTSELFTNSIATPLDAVWLKAPLRPSLNRVIVPGDFSDITRRGRSGVFDVKGSSLPIEVSEARRSRQWTQIVIAEDGTEAQALNDVLDSGETLFLQVPANCPVPGGYVHVGDLNERRGSRRGTRRHLHLPLTEVAAPDPAMSPVE